VPRWVWGAALVAVVTGCAGVPASGPVHIAQQLPAVAGIDSSNIRQLPPGPTTGMTPTGLVGGFLYALFDSDSNYSVARTFLAPGTSWNSTSGITLYEENSAVITRETARLVEVSVQRVGAVDGRGSYRAVPGSLQVQFRIVRLDGQWRISHLPPGVLLSTADAERSLQPADLYYFNRAQTRLVPEPVLVPPNQPGLATTLIDRLLAGPSRALAPAVVTAFPTGTSLAGNVPIDSNGVAEIDLSGSVQQLSSTALGRLSAQIVWTLRQLSAVTAVQLLDNGAPLSGAGVASVQSVGAWPQFDPETPATSRGALLSDGGRVFGLNRSVPGSLLHRALSAPVVSADGATVAALRRENGATTLLVGSTVGPLRPRLSSPRLSAPAFDPQGDVIVVSGVGAQSIVIEVPREGRVREVEVPPDIRNQGISQVAVSRDGSRIAMVVGRHGREALVVGAISVTRRGPVITGGAVVIPAAQDARGVAWAGANEIVTTVRKSAARRAVVETTVDGYGAHVLTGLGLSTDPTQVAAAPGQPVLAGASGGVWLLSDHRWRRVSTGGDPSYAG
jgi:Lipoprotein LpqB beta-propeller domain/Sporulation and spore germination